MQYGEEEISSAIAIEEISKEKRVLGFYRGHSIRELVVKKKKKKERKREGEDKTYLGIYIQEKLSFVISSNTAVGFLNHCYFKRSLNLR
jgi:hypothetical protein